ncbi:MAG: hypothetical protein WCC52_03970, partial [Nitrosotalea sp.]
NEINSIEYIAKTTGRAIMIFLSLFTISWLMSKTDLRKMELWHKIQFHCGTIRKETICPNMSKRR